MISAILLAAGESKRMEDENKLIKEIDGIPLIKYAVKNILGSAVDELVVVLGHEKIIIENIIEKNKKIKFVYNESYQKGISTSIIKGLNSVSKKTKAFFICMGDMPDVNQSIYNKLIKTRYNYNKELSSDKKKEIFIPTFEEKKGNPILCSKFILEKIINNDEDFSAKKITEENEDKILYVPVKSNGIILDFDTKDDFISS